jgi:hypothetical protein
MGRCRVVLPDVVRLPLSDGDWLEVKKRLNAGEYRAMLERMTMVGADGKAKPNPLMHGVSKVVAYLLDWSLVGLDGKVILIADKPIDTVQRALDSIDSETMTEIIKAVSAHEEAMDAEREAAKNATDGGSKLPATLPSPSDVAGVLTGSVN